MTDLATELVWPVIWFWGIAWHNDISFVPTLASMAPRREINGLSPQVSDHTQMQSSTLPGVCLDEQIAPVIDYLAGLGATTMFSCQGDPDQGPMETPHSGYIMFASPDDLTVATRVLAKLALDANLSSLAARILGANSIRLIGGGLARNTDEAALGRWRYELSRYSEPWGSETDRMRATVRLNFEDVVSLSHLLFISRLSPEACL